MEGKQLDLSKYLWVCLLSLALSVNANAQSDTTYVLLRNGEEARFTFLKITEAGQYSRRELVFPQYSLSGRQLKRIIQLLERFVSIEADYEYLKKLQLEKDSITSLRASGMSDVLRKASLRADNFQNGYDKLLVINQQLDETLKKCEAVALTSQKRNRRLVLFTGIMAGAAGFLIGAIAL